MEIISEIHSIQSENPGLDGFAEKVKLEKGRLLGFIRKQIDDVEDAEDLLQDVLEQYVKLGSDGESVEDSVAWLYAVAKHKIVDFFRKRRPISEHRFHEGERMIWDTAVSNRPAPDDVWMSELFLEVLEDALAELPMAQRWVFEQHEMEGRSFQALAKETGEAVNTLISRKRYAVVHLRNRLEPMYREMVTDKQAN
ncbi:MAG: RNA polymerase sigma factor [Flavobacteriales bacterium]|nr:RNA polymerase sigma factor [Flavobacteriales bacterium]